MADKSSVVTQGREHLLETGYTGGSSSPSPDTICRGTPDSNKKKRIKGSRKRGQRTPPITESSSDTPGEGSNYIKSFNSEPQVDISNFDNYQLQHPPPVTESTEPKNPNLLLQQLQKKMAELHDRLASEAAEKQRIANENKKLVTENHQLSTKIDQLTADNKKLTVDNDQLSTQTDQSTAKCDELDAEKCEIAAQNDLLATRCVRLAEEKQQASTKIEQLTTEKNKLATELDRLRPRRTLRRHQSLHGPTSNPSVSTFLRPSATRRTIYPVIPPENLFKKRMTGELPHIPPK